MKVIALCGGKNRFRGYDTKPRHLYSVNGKVQIMRVIEPFLKLGMPIESFRFVVSDKKPFQKFFEKNNLNPEIVENKKPYGSAVYSLKAGLKGLETYNKPIIITQDELISQDAIQKLIDQPGKLVCYKRKDKAADTAVIKISPELTGFFTDDRYLSTEYYAKDRDMYDTYFRQWNEPTPKQFPFRIESGSGLVFMMIHAIFRIEKRFPEKCFFLQEKITYASKDLDKIYETDEFQSVKKYGKDLGKVLFFLKQNFNNFFKIGKK